MQKSIRNLALSITLLLLLGLSACLEQADEPAPDPSDAAEVLSAPAVVERSFREPAAAPLSLETQGFSCRVVAWTCTSTAQCDAMCGGPGTGVCNFATLCCACRI